MNTLSDLNTMLFEQMCKLSKDDISSETELTKTGLNIAKIRIKLAELRKEKK